jgi:DNA polymerase-1
MAIQATTADARKLMHDGIQALSKASIQGMRIDVPYVKKQNKYLNKKCKSLEVEFGKTDIGKKWKKTFLSPNYNADAQLREILFKKEGIKPVKQTKPSKKYPKGQASVDNESLELISKSIPDLAPFMEYKKLTKVNNTFLAGILKEQVDGVLHPFFHLHLARTYRSSSSNINFHNQPNRDKKQKKIVRTSFIPTPGHRFLAADFTGIEVGNSCCYHKDKNMLNYVRHPELNNMHTDMAIQCYMLDQFRKDGAEKTLRKGAKNGFVFPQFYGDYYKNNAASLAAWGDLPTKGAFSKKVGLELMNGKTLGKHLRSKGIANYDDFVEHIKRVENDFWNNRFTGYRDWKKENVLDYYKKGHLTTLTGFTCSGEMSENDINNYPIQGAAFHTLLKTFIEVQRRMIKYKMKSKLIGQIHDELVFDAHASETQYLLEIVRKVACQWVPKQWEWIIVPITLEANIQEVDANWATGSTVQVLEAA